MDWGISPQTYDLSPPFSLELELIEAIESAICLALKRIGSRVNIHSAPERNITDILEEELIKIYQFSEVDGFSQDTCETPGRGEEHKDFTGKQIENRPDIKIAIRSSRIVAHKKYHAYFIECKVVLDTASVTAYADEGLQRFSDGKYAWPVNYAGMLAYVRPNAHYRDPELSLKGYFNKSGLGKARRRRQKLKEGPRKVQGVPSIVETVHARPFKVPDDRWGETDKMAGPITVRHLWLSLG